MTWLKAQPTDVGLPGSNCLQNSGQDDQISEAPPQEEQNKKGIVLHVNKEEGQGDLFNILDSKRYNSFEKLTRVAYFVIKFIRQRCPSLAKKGGTFNMTTTRQWLLATHQETHSVALSRSP